MKLHLENKFTKTFPSPGGRGCRGGDSEILITPTSPSPVEGEGNVVESYGLGILNLAKTQEGGKMINGVKTKCYG